MVDEQIDEEKLVAQFRERLTSRLEELGLGQSGLASVFEEVDVAGRGELTIKELSHVMFTLNFHASKVNIFASVPSALSERLDESEHARSATIPPDAPPFARLFVAPQARGISGTRRASSRNAGRAALPGRRKRPFS